MAIHKAFQISVKKKLYPAQKHIYVNNIIYSFFKSNHCLLIKLIFINMACNYIITNYNYQNISLINTFIVAFLRYYKWFPTNTYNLVETYI